MSYDNFFEVNVTGTEKDFEESKHRRADDGKFSSSGGRSSSSGLKDGDVSEHRKKTQYLSKANPSLAKKAKNERQLLNIIDKHSAGHDEGWVNLNEHTYNNSLTRRHLDALVKSGKAESQEGRPWVARRTDRHERADQSNARAFHDAKQIQQKRSSAKG